MTDRIVKVLENDRYVTRGISHARRRLYANQAEDESLAYTMDFTAWLGSDTIASVTSEQRGVTVGLANDTTTVTATLSAMRSRGYAKIRITTAASAIKEVMIHTRETEGIPVDDYDACA